MRSLSIPRSSFVLCYPTLNVLLSEAVQLALIDKVPSIAAACASIVAAFGAALGGYFSYKAHGTAKYVAEIARETNDVAKKTEQNTNHLKDELVEAVSRERFAAGQKQEADDQAASALFLADNQKEK